MMTMQLQSVPSKAAAGWPLISVITPSFNQGRFIRATIESVLNQDHPYVEYIVADGGSTDETVPILKEYGGRIRWVSEPDNGQTDAINKGLRMSSGDIVAYLNSDDIYLPHALRNVAQAFAQHPDVDFVYGDSVAIDQDGKVLNRIKTIPFDPDILLYDANFICQPSSFYSRRLIEEIGPFDESLYYLMDYEFFLRAAKRKVKFHLIADYLAAIRYHEACKTLANGIYPWVDERRAIRLRYARQKVRTPSALRLLSVIFRLKRYGRLLLRGRLDFMNLALAYKLRRIN